MIQWLQHCCMEVHRWLSQVGWGICLGSRRTEWQNFHHHKVLDMHWSMSFWIFSQIFIPTQHMNSYLWQGGLGVWYVWWLEPIHTHWFAVSVCPFLLIISEVGGEIHLRDYTKFKTLRTTVSGDNSHVSLCASITITKIGCGSGCPLLHVINIVYFDGCVIHNRERRNIQGDPVLTDMLFLHCCDKLQLCLIFMCYNCNCSLSGLVL